MDTVDTVIDTLDRFYCANVVTALWAWWFPSLRRADSLTSNENLAS